MTVSEQLFTMQDAAYRAFHCRLIPEVPPETVIGVRTPQLRAFAKTLAGTPQAAAFMATLPHRYYDENNLHAFLIERIGDFEQTVEALERFLPYVNNWATCDMLRPPVFRKNRPALREHIARFLAAEHTFTVRFGIVMLMTHFLEDAFLPSDISAVTAVDAEREEYYIRMAVAWYFATALAKQYDAAIAVLEKRALSPFTHNKAIGKACESRRLSDEQKAYLRTLRV